MNFLGLVVVAWINVRGNRRMDKKVTEVKADTKVINDSVNHVEDGEPPLTKRFNDFRAVTNETLEEIRLKAIETNDAIVERFDGLDEKMEGFTEVATGLMKMHLKTSQDVASIREVVDNRKNSFSEDPQAS